MIRESIHRFCRMRQAQIMVEVRAKFTKDEIKSAWVAQTGMRRGNPDFEFHGPNETYDHNLKGADCRWSAMAEGWQNLLDRMEDAQTATTNQEKPNEIQA